MLEGVHSGTVRSCSWSPDGSCLATASFDKTVGIWERHHEEWEHVAMLEGHDNEVKGVAWNSNGSLLATCGRDKTVWFWESQPQHEYDVVDVKHGHTQDVKCVKWHPDGEMLVSVSYDDSIKMWMESEDEWVCVKTVSGSPDGHTSTVWDVSFEPSGKYMATCSDDKTIKIWKIGVGHAEVTCQLMVTLSGYHSRTVYSVDWSPCGRYIASAGADNTITIFEVDWKEVGDTVECSVVQQVLAAHPLDINCVRWNPKSPHMLASAGDDGRICVWSLTQN